jgi:hypothetical protein
MLPLVFVIERDQLMIDLSKLFPSTLLRRTDCAAALTESGYPTSPKTLATLATRGGGPPYHKFGRTVLYRWSNALGWAEARLSPPRCSSSEFVMPGQHQSPSSHEGCKGGSRVFRPP